MEKNCINCKYNIPVTRADYGFCNHKDHLGRIANEHTSCSEHEAQEALAHSAEEIQEVLLGIKCCTDPQGGGCAKCPFARYKCTCQQDLMFAARQIISKQLERIEALELDVGGYVADQEIWLTKCDSLQKQVDSGNKMYDLAKAFHDEKCAEYDLLLHDYNKAKAENTELKTKVSDLRERLHWIWAIGVDYDGCNTVKSLKELIDELVAFTQKDDVPIFGSVAPRAAKWIKAECSEKDGDATCSYCGHWDWSDGNYCSVCGSRMIK
jgi:hypothetical protein